MFRKKNTPVFLKEDSDLEKHIERLTQLRGNASNQVKEQIDLELRFAQAGYVGEQNIAFELKNSGIPMYILKDICLEANGLKTQIDYIVITERLTLIIECKNLIGNITIDNAGRFVREYSLGNRKIKEGFYSPITQNERHMEVLKQARLNEKKNVFMKYMLEKYFDENFKSIVVLANPKTILNDKYAKKEIKDKIIRADQLIQYIKDINKNSKTSVRKDEEMRGFGDVLLSMHKANNSDYLKKHEDLMRTSDGSPIVATEKSNLSSKVLQEGNPDEESSVREECIRELKAFRLEISRSEKVKPYYIFTDAQMQGLLEKYPTTKEELKSISGFGEVKVEKYGEAILKILNKEKMDTVPVPVSIF